jgi:glycosyltransferase involved in cell wall biosynthesis
MNIKPKVSIVTPTLNSEEFISGNIRSILGQTHSNIEHIIVDGGSTDRTLQIVKDLNPDAVVISEPDEGIADAYNKGVRNARGDLIAILNSDDYYVNDRVLEGVVEKFSSRPAINIVYGKVRVIEPRTGKTVVVYGQPFSPKRMGEFTVSQAAVFARREVFEAVGPFSLKYRICMDLDYFLRAVSLFKPYFLDEILVTMYWGGLSTRNIYLGHREAFNILRSHGMGLASATVNLLYGYSMTTLSLALQKIGLPSVVLFYRKKRGQLE